MIKKVLIIFSIWFVIINLFAFISLNRLTLSPDTSYGWINQDEFFQNKKADLITLHSRWDSFWYLDIAQNGYSYNEGKLSNIVFFPLYPSLIKVVSIMTMGNFELAGWVISSLFLILGAIFLYKLVLKFHPEIDARWTIIFLLIFPTAFFFNAVYTESLFLFLSVACFYFTFSKKYQVASIFGLLASLTRFTGFLLFIPIIYEYLQAQHFKPKISWEILPSFLIPLGALFFPLYHFFAFGDYSLFLKVEETFGRNFTFNSDHFQLNTSSSIANFTIDLSYLILIVIVTFLIAKKLKVSYSLYMLGTVLIALSTGTLMSIGRYILPLFPMYILFASVKNENLRFIIILTSILFLSLTTILFVNNYWAG